MSKGKTIQSLIAVLAATILHGCGSSVYYVNPPDWSDRAKQDSTIQYFRDVLDGVTVFIDPGHGGDDRGSKGHSGDLDEATLNLRVSLLLRDYLQQAGAKVILSREADRTVPLSARAQQANTNNADLFISIHHNAAGNAFTNYTTTFYHARIEEPGYKPSSQDLARYIQRDLSYVMGNPGPLSSFDGTMSDYVIAENKGFAVLRETKMTGVLVECAFLTSAYEEQRLMIEEFNHIQAWGIFRGIGKYLRAGIPQLRYASPIAFTDHRPRIDIQVIDRSDIRDELIRVFIDGREEGFTYNRKTGLLSVTPAEPLAQGYHHLTTQVRNSNGNSSAPFDVHFSVGQPPVMMRSAVEPPLLPRDGRAFSKVTITALDSAGRSVPDGLPIRFTASNGIDTLLVLQSGSAIAYLFPGERERVTFEASNGPVKTHGLVTTSPDAQYTRGIVIGGDGKPVAGATIQLPGGKTTTTGATGEYFITGSSTSGVEVVIRAPGYFGKREALTGEPVQDPVTLTPVAKGLLIGKVFLLDPVAEQGMENAARIDVRTIRALRELLTASGATVISLTEQEKKSRQAFIAANRNATVVHVAENALPRITIRTGGHQQARSLSEQLMKTLPEFTGVSLDRFIQRMTSREELDRMKHISIWLPPPGKGYAESLAPLFAWNIAWGVYSSILLHEGYSTKGTRLVEVSVQNKETNTPASGALVELNHALRMMTDGKGVCRFRAVSIVEDDVQVIDPEKYVITGVKTEIIGN